MDTRGISIVDQLQRLAALPERSGPEIVQAALFNILLEAAASEQAGVADSLARLKAIHAVRQSAKVGKDALDTLSEMGELESLRLQMAMDRLSKFMTSLSNLLKKSADTAATIARNLK